MGIKKYNDMKEHSISRIHPIRHPSLVNTHQSLCAHNLITKHIAAVWRLPISEDYCKHRHEVTVVYILDFFFFNGNIRIVEKHGGFVHLRQPLLLGGFLRIVTLLLLFSLSSSRTATAESSEKLTHHLMGNYGCDLVNSPQSFYFKREALRSRNIAVARRKATETEQ